MTQEAFSGGEGGLKKIEENGEREKSKDYNNNNKMKMVFLYS